MLKNFNWKKHWLLIFCYLFLLSAFILNFIRLCHGDIIFHTDIARDFLILEEMVEQHKPSLIGARTSMPGVFHGPAWYYLNLPVFFLSHGNPVASGWFWLFLTTLAFATFYLLTKKIFTPNIALLSTTFLVSRFMNFSMGLGQQSGAFFLALPFFYCLWLYLQEHRLWQLLLTLVIGGFLIQFQMAFGGPILILTVAYLIYDLIKNKNFSHFLGFFILILPLSSYLVFDLRHDFLQTRAMLNYLSPGGNEANFSLTQRLTSFINCFALINYGFQLKFLQIVNALATLAFLVWVGFLVKRDSPKIQLAYRLSLFFTFGYWLVTLLYKGVIWGFYYENLIPLFIIWIGYVVVKEKNFLLQLIFVALLSIHFYFNWQWEKAYLLDHRQNDLYWNFYQQLAHDLFTRSSEPFGYYVFTPDLYGYQVKYTLKYFSHFYEHSTFVNQKLPTTYLIMTTAKKNSPVYQIIHEYQIAWHDYKVGFKRPADKTWSYDAAGYWVEAYNLDEEEQQIPSDPYLLKGLEMR